MEEEINIYPRPEPELTFPIGKVIIVIITLLILGSAGFFGYQKMYKKVVHALSVRDLELKKFSFSGKVKEIGVDSFQVEALLMEDGNIEYRTYTIQADHNTTFENSSGTTTVVGFKSIYSDANVVIYTHEDPFINETITASRIEFN